MLIDNLKILYPSIGDAVLEMVIEQVEEDLLEYCNIQEIPENTSALLLAMAKEKINILGAEGFTTENVAGSSITLTGDYSAGIYKRLNKYKRIKTVGW